MIYLRLFFEFAKTGLFAVGGGMAALPFLYAMSESTGWFTHTDVANMIAISESTPGALGINMATYAGFITAGVPGGIIATLGLITPSIIIILIIARMLDRFRDSPLVQRGFYGLRPASIALVAAAGISVAKVTLVNLSALAGGDLANGILWKSLALAVVVFVGQKVFPKLHPVLFLLLGAVVGIVFHF